MTNSSETPIHPGTYVRKTIIPPGMSVKEAAKQLGIGRSALSNFLNGNSALSQKMAIRLEKAFGADQKRLLDMQAAYNQYKQFANEEEVAVRAFVPSFLTIKARQIEDWADSKIDARAHLPVLLRRLVHSTGMNLSHVDFPGYDNSQRKGSDGYVKAGAATPWIPKGVSYWEFGTNRDPSAKANRDYNVRLGSVERVERANSTFVFVTPRNWPGKIKWEKLKNETDDWKAVRAFDASDLEQWLEQSVPTQIWLAEQLGLPVNGYETIEQAWYRWASVSEPRLTPEIFTPSITLHQNTFRTWINEPSNRPFIVAADSRDEALAFIACLFDGDGLQQSKDLAAVFTSPTTLRTLLASPIPFIPIIHSMDVERELADAYNRLHCIVFRPRNAVDMKADITLDLLSYEAFEMALTAMGMTKEDIDQLAMESGRSPTILRRRLSKNAAIRTPVWSSDDDIAKTLVPLALIGVWNTDSETDCEIVSNLADRKYETIEDNVARLLGVDDAPVWSAGMYRGVVSKIDALFAIARMVTQIDLDQFFISAEKILSESDPALDLPEDKRWAASIYGKERDYSSALREGICETLVILSVHGNNLFQDRIGIDIERRVTVLIHNLLTPLTLEKLQSHDYDLPRYAEAAPDEFLNIIEEDLRSNAPVVLGLLKPVDTSLFWASPSRTGLLWALECLAWKPQNLPRVSVILAQLSQSKINDNWMNKPDASLQAIFRSWMPQTAATVDQRAKALEMLVRRFPDIGWKICIEQFKPGTRIGNYSYRPRWCSDSSGAGQVVTYKEICNFKRKALDIMVTWSTHDEKTLGDLIESIMGMPLEAQDKVWDMIDVWSRSANDAAKAELRERIRLFAFTRFSAQTKLNQTMGDRAHEAYDALQPNNLIIRHSWLFAEYWVQESADEIDEIVNEYLGYRKREERIDSLRREAMSEIYTGFGFEGVIELLAGSDAAGIVGHYVASCVTEDIPMINFIRRCLSLDEGIRNKAEWCLQGLLNSINEDTLVRILQAATKGLSAKDCMRLFICAPFQASTWRLLDGYSEDIRAGYWTNVSPSWGRRSSTEFSEMIDRLLEARRPRAAFHAIRMDFKDIETSRLKRLMRDVATVNAEPTDHFKLNRYYISEALNSLDGRPGVSTDDMAKLEFLYIDILEDTNHGIPNLERQLVQSPALFFRAIALTHKRCDAAEDPPEFHQMSPEQHKAVASRARQLLDQIKIIPGSNENGIIDTSALVMWVKEVRRLCQEHARTYIGDHFIGQLFAKSPKDMNGMWPCKAVCEAMETIASQGIDRGFSIGVYNSRGVYTPVEGGEQERSIATKYRFWAEQLNFDYPFVGKVLGNIAAYYEREGQWLDSEAEIAKRLHYYH